MSGDKEMLLSFSNMHANSTLISIWKLWLHYFEAGTLRCFIFVRYLCGICYFAVHCRSRMWQCTVSGRLEAVAKFRAPSGCGGCCTPFVSFRRPVAVSLLYLTAHNIRRSRPVLWISQQPFNMLGQLGSVGSF
jgi:hypothetical protein